MKDCHRLFLRSFMSKKILSKSDTMKTYKKSCELYGDECPEGGLAAFIEVVNVNLRKLFLEVKRGKSEDNGSVFYGLVNTSDQDEHSKMATDFTANDIAFFKKAMDLMVASDTGTVSSLDLGNAGLDLDKPMTLNYVELLLEKLVHNKWMSCSSGQYSLGPRAMLELHPYLKRVYDDDIVDCMMCREIVIKGQLCSECDGKLHNHCAVTYYRGRAQRTCPNKKCGATWIHEIPEAPQVNEDANTPATQRGRFSAASSSSTSHHRRRKR